LYLRLDVEGLGVISVGKNYVVGCIRKKVHYLILMKTIIGAIVPRQMIRVQALIIVQVDTTPTRIFPLNQDLSRGRYRDQSKGRFRGRLGDPLCGTLTIEVDSKRKHKGELDLQSYQ
jgi:hypothetical protein